MRRVTTRKVFNYVYGILLACQVCTLHDIRHSFASKESLCDCRSKCTHAFYIYNAAVSFSNRSKKFFCCEIAVTMTLMVIPVLPVIMMFMSFSRFLYFECLSCFFFLRLPIGQYGPVSQLSRSEERCTGPFNWGEAHCAGEKVKRKIGPFLRKSLKNQTRTRTQQKGAQPATATRNPLARLPGARAKEETNPTNKRLHQQILVRLNVLDLQWTIL